MLFFLYLTVISLISLLDNFLKFELITELNGLRNSSIKPRAAVYILAKLASFVEKKRFGVEKRAAQIEFAALRRSAERIPPRSDLTSLILARLSSTGLEIRNPRVERRIVIRQTQRARVRIRR